MVLWLMTYKRQDAEFKAKLSNRADEIRSWENQQTRDANARHARNAEQAQARDIARHVSLPRAFGYLVLAFAVTGLGMACGNWFCLVAMSIPAVMITVYGFCKV